jgi:O-antigen ligase
MREIVLFILVIISVPLILKNPFFGLMIYFGAGIIRPEMLFWGGFGGSYIYMFCYLLVIASFLYHGYLLKIGQALKREYIIMAWLLFAMLISAVFSKYPIIQGYYFLFELFKLFCMCALLYVLVVGFPEIRKFQSVLLGCLFFLGIWGMQQHFLGNDRLEGLGGAGWGDSNGVASMYVLFLPVALAMIFSSQKRSEKLLGFGVVAVMVFVIVFTMSRAGLLGLVASFCAFGYFSRNSKKILLTIISIALLVSPFVTESYISRVETMKNVENADKMDYSAESRLILWQAGLMVFRDNPLIGTGFLTYPEAKMKYENKFNYLDETFRKYVFRMEDKKVTHNTYIQVLSDCGLFGAIPFYLLIFGGIGKGFKARRLLIIKPEYRTELIWLSGISAGLFGLAVCIITLDAIVASFLYIQVIIASILCRIIMNEDILLPFTEKRTLV